MGDNGAVIAQILAVVLFLFFCFVTYMNTKTWRATHVTFLFLTFAATFAFIVYAALNLKTRSSWQKVEAELVKKDEQETAIGTKLLYGKDDVPETEPGVADIRQTVNLVTIDRGRVWRGVTMVNSQVGALNSATGGAPVTVQLSTRPPDLQEGAQFEPNHMKKGMTLFAFRDRTQNPSDIRYLYVGEFQADEATDGGVTLKSTMDLSPLDQSLVKGNEPWVLYETMPVDSHEALTAAGGTLEQALRPDDFVDPKQHPGVLADYKRDGGEAQPNDPPERVFAKVRFLKEYTFKVDAPDARPPTATDTPFYDSTGQALDPRLRRGSDITFKTGDEAEIILQGYKNPDTGVEEVGAEQLANDGVLEILSKVYRRPLNDYAYEFRYFYERMNVIRASLALVERDTKTLEEEEKLATENRKIVEKQIALVKADLANVENERKKITAYADQVEKSYREARNELSRLYRENSALYDEIVAANERLTREIDARALSKAE